MPDLLILFRVISFLFRGILLSKFLFFVSGLLLASLLAFAQVAHPVAVQGNDGMGGLETHPDAIDAPGAVPILIGLCSSLPAVKTCTLVCVTTSTSLMDVTFTESDGTVYTYANATTFTPFGGHVIGRVTVWQCWWSGTEWLGVRTA